MTIGQRHAVDTLFQASPLSRPALEPHALEVHLVTASHPSDERAHGQRARGHFVRPVGHGSELGIGQHVPAQHLRRDLE